MISLLLWLKTPFKVSVKPMSMSTVPLRIPPALEVTLKVPLNPLELICHCPSGTAMILSPYSTKNATCVMSRFLFNLEEYPQPQKIRPITLVWVDAGLTLCRARAARRARGAERERALAG